MISKKYPVGSVYSIPDEDRGFYYACIANGGDVLFLDINTQDIDTGVLEKRFFLRLPVIYPSMKRAGWKRVAIFPVEGDVAEKGYYRYQRFDMPEPAIWCFDEETYFFPEGKNFPKLEILAFWDAQYHILPLLRYHFFKIETPILKKIVTPI